MPAISALGAMTAITVDDLLCFVNDPGGTPVTKKITIAHFLASLGLVGTPALVAKRLSADQTYTSNATLQNVTDLSFAIGASEIWIAIVVAHYKGPTAGDIQVAWSLPAGAAGLQGTIGLSTGASNATDTPSLSSVALGITNDRGTVGTGTTVPLVVVATMRNSTTAGTATFQAAQNTSNGTATTLLADSFLLAVRIA